jgi:hypothetical protein
MALDNYRILVQNDESPWDDKTGERYHFPRSKYLNRLSPGMKIIYYKGRVGREQPEYFGYGEISRIYPDPKSKSDYYADISGYIQFNNPVKFKLDGKYLEDITSSNPFRQNSVRIISEERFYKILMLAELNLEKTGNVEQPVVIRELPLVSEVTINLATTSLIKPIQPKSKGGVTEPPTNYFNSKKSTLHGKQGEFLVMKHLRETLTEEESKTLRHNAIENEKDGYDISYVDLSGKPRYIEVKATSAASFASFLLTINELTAAENYREAYFIYLVNRVTSKDVSIEVIGNPAELLQTEKLIKSPMSFKIEMNNTP